MPEKLVVIKLLASKKYKNSKLFWTVDFFLWTTERVARKPKLTIICLAETICLPQVREDSRCLSVFYLSRGKQGTLSLLLFLLLSWCLQFLHLGFGPDLLGM